VKSTVVLRSSEWDGPSPSPGDVVEHEHLGELFVNGVAAGAGLGHFTLSCEPMTGRRWRWRSET
jgi:hypothetical protein